MKESLRSRVFSVAVASLAIAAVFAASWAHASVLFAGLVAHEVVRHWPAPGSTADVPPVAGATAHP